MPRTTSARRDDYVMLRQFNTNTLMGPASAASKERLYCGNTQEEMNGRWD